MTELHNKLLEISKELGLATMNDEIGSSLAIKLNKKLSEAINFIPCCDKLPNIESTEFRDWMTDNGYTDEQYGTIQKGDERYCINNLFKHYQNLLEFGN